MEVFEFFVGDAEFDATKRIGLDEIDELPTNGALWKVGVETANVLREKRRLGVSGERRRAGPCRLE